MSSTIKGKLELEQSISKEIAKAESSVLGFLKSSQKLNKALDDIKKNKVGVDVDDSDVRALEESIQRLRKEASRF